MISDDPFESQSSSEEADEIEGGTNDFFETQEEISANVSARATNDFITDSIELEHANILSSSDEEIEKVDTEQYFKKEFVTFIIQEEARDDLEIWDCNDVKILSCIFESSDTENQSKFDLSSVNLIIRFNGDCGDIEGSRIVVYTPFHAFYYNNKNCLIVTEYSLLQSE